jgi:hypothetical protein
MNENCKRALLSLMFFTLIITVWVPLNSHWNDIKFEEDLKVAIRDYSLTTCGRTVEVDRVNYNWAIMGSSSVMWNVSSDQGEFIGTIYRGKVTLKDSICKRELNLVLHREQQAFLPDTKDGTDQLPSSWETYTPPGPIVSFSEVIIIGGIIILFLLSCSYFYLNKKSYR